MKNASRRTRPGGGAYWVGAASCTSSPSAERRDDRLQWWTLYTRLPNPRCVRYRRAGHAGGHFPLPRRICPKTPHRLATGLWSCLAKKGRRRGTLHLSRRSPPFLRSRRTSESTWASRDAAIAQRSTPGLGGI